MPDGVGRVIAAGAGLAASQLWRSERARLFETIDRVYHRMDRIPPLPIATIVEQTFIHFALVGAELLRFPCFSEDDFKKRMEFRGIENLQKALAQGRGVVLAVPHIGSWEMLGAAIAHAGFPLHSFYLGQKEGGIGEALDYFRTFSKIILHDRDRGLMASLRALKKGDLLGMIPDQDGGNHGIYLDFLGHWVSLPAGPANWSLKTGALVVPLWSLREGRSNRYVAHFLPHLPEETASSLDQRIIDRTRRLAGWMQEIILACPHQYLWFYDRFKPRHHDHISHLKQAGVKMRAGGACLGHD